MGNIFHDRELHYIKDIYFYFPLVLQYVSFFITLVVCMISFDVLYGTELIYNELIKHTNKNSKLSLLNSFYRYGLIVAIARKMHGFIEKRNVPQ